MSGVLIGGRVGHCAEDLDVPGHSRCRGGPVIKERARRAYGGCAPQAIALSLMLGAATSGCSLSYKLDSFFGQGCREGRAHRLDPPGVSAPPTPRQPRRPTIDLAYAKAAAAACSASRTRTRASLGRTPPPARAERSPPIADAYTQDGFQCRDFLASYIRDGAESWLQGDACRIHQGKWTVRTMRPLKRT